MEAKDLVFVGFSKVYKESNQLIGNAVVLQQVQPIGMRCYYFYLCKTGNLIYKDLFDCKVSRIKVEKNEFGIEYITYFKDDMGQKYYISPITKTITNTMEVTIEL